MRMPVCTGGAEGLRAAGASRGAAPAPPCEGYEGMNNWPGLSGRVTRYREQLRAFFSLKEIKFSLEVVSNC